MSIIQNNETYNYKGYQVVINKENYAKGNMPYLELVEVLSSGNLGEVVTVITVNTPAKLPKGLITVKDYNENTGLLDWLQYNKIVGDIVGIIPSGFVEIPVVELLV